MNDLLINFVSSLVLLPGPILPTAADVSALFAGGAPAIEQPAASPPPAVSVDTLLALPSGFRAPGFEGLAAVRTAGRDTFGMTAAQADAVRDTINDDIDADRDGMFGRGFLPRSAGN
jgi:hypothetical protein